MVTGSGPKSDIFSGLEWGAHLCQFYETDQDLLDVLVPYFKQGIENNSQCLWLSTGRSTDGELMYALRSAVPDIDACWERGQIRIVAEADWYLNSGGFSASALLDRGSAKLEQALAAGYDGIWLAGDVGRAGEGDWQALNLHEEAVCTHIPNAPVVALCAYPSREYRVPDILTVFKNHRSVLIKQEGQWRIIESLEQMRIQSALQKSEQTYRHLFDSVLEGVEVVDTEKRRVLLANEACARIFGFGSPEEMVGTDPIDCIPECAREQAIHLLAEHVIHRDPQKAVEIEVMTRDGRDLWVAAFGLTTEYDGRPAALLSIRDITAQKLAEKAARESEERMRLLIDSANESILIIQDWKVASANRRFEEIIGIPRQSLAGSHILDLTHPNDRQAVADRYRKIMNGERFSTGAPLRGFDRDGKVRWAEVTEIPFIWEGRPAVMSLMHDITERVESEQALRASEERFRALIENSLDAIAILDVEGCIIYESQSEKRILGYEPDQLAGRSFLDIVHPDDTERAISTVESVKERPGSILDCQLRCRHKDGSWCPVEGTAHNLLHDAKIKGIVVNYRDITERRRIALQLEDSLRKLEKTMEDTIQAISSTMETRDPYTAGHQRRVTQLACAIAKTMGLPDDQINGIRVAGLLHDIGKISVPTEILSKPGRLNASEFAMIRSHAKTGYEILKSIDFNWPIASTVLQHHERIDGSGYPAGLRGEEILLEARILAVADVVEAMSSDRPYRPSVGLEKALEEISHGAGKLYDPQVVRACLQAFRENHFSF